MYVKFNDDVFGPIVSAAFPKNRKDIAIRKFCGPKPVNSYWDGGTKDEYVLVSLVDKQSLGLPTSHPYFDRKDDGSRVGNVELRELPPNVVLVQGGTFCGKAATVTVFVRPDNLATLLPPPVQLPPQELAALNIIASTKSSYRHDEFSRSGLGAYSASNQWVVALQERGLVKVNKAGAVSITTEGRNARA